MSDECKTLRPTSCAPARISPRMRGTAHPDNECFLFCPHPSRGTNDVPAPSLSLPILLPYTIPTSNPVDDAAVAATPRRRPSACIYPGFILFSCRSRRADGKFLNIGWKRYCATKVHNVDRSSAPFLAARDLISARAFRARQLFSFFCVRARSAR